jgi:hypothetical protein
LAARVLPCRRAIEEEMTMDLSAINAGQKVAQDNTDLTPEDQQVLQDGFAQVLGSMMMNQQNIMSMLTNQILHDTIDDL